VQSVIVRERAARSSMFRVIGPTVCTLV